MANLQDACVSISRPKRQQPGDCYQSPWAQPEVTHPIPHEDGTNCSSFANTTSTVSTILSSTDSSFCGASKMSSVNTSESSTTSTSGSSSQQSSSLSDCMNYNVNLTSQQTSKVNININQAQCVYIAPKTTRKRSHRKRATQEDGNGSSERSDGQKKPRTGIYTIAHPDSLSRENGEAADVRTDGEERYVTRGDTSLHLENAIPYLHAGHISQNQPSASLQHNQNWRNLPGATLGAQDTSVVKRTCCSRLKTTPGFITIVVLVASLMGGVIAYLEWKKVSEQERTYRSTGLVSVSVDDSFHPSMSDNSSAEFKAFETKLCYSLAQKLAENPFVLDSQCAVQNLSKGSIVAEFTLDLQTTVNGSSEWVRSELLTSGNTNGGIVYWLSLPVKKSSVRVISFVSELVDLLPKTQPTPAVDCTKNSFQPLPYTYPSYCGEFQICTSAGIEYLTCPEGLEFSSASRVNRKVCDVPSDTTYCGQKRRENPATTPARTDAATAASSTRSIATTVDTTSGAWTTSIQTTSKQSSTTASTTESAVRNNVTATYPPCPDFASDAQVYSKLVQCPATGYIFVPRPDTFPDNCDGYIWCVNGLTYNSSVIKCGAGAHYTMKSDGPCYPAGHPDTFCQVMHRCGGH